MTPSLLRDVDTAATTFVVRRILVIIAAFPAWQFSRTWDRHGKGGLHPLPGLPPGAWVGSSPSILSPRHHSTAVIPKGADNHREHDSEQDPASRCREKPGKEGGDLRPKRGNGARSRSHRLMTAGTTQVVGLFAT
jgi:hypothetical protein